LDLKTKTFRDLKHLATALNVEDFVATLLVQRGINTLRKQSIFRPSLDNLHDPYLMKDMEKARTHRESNRKRRKYSCFGDYDVDGTTCFCSFLPI
jgi:single-stranded-DNA-specific exonuclease